MLHDGKALNICCDNLNHAPELQASATGGAVLCTVRITQCVCVVVVVGGTNQHAKGFKVQQPLWEVTMATPHTRRMSLFLSRRWPPSGDLPPMGTDVYMMLQREQIHILPTHNDSTVGI